MTSDLSKQEYLKRYLEGDDKDKKRKKRVKTAATILPRIKIINQDIDIKSINFGNKDVEEFANVAEDRPIVVKVEDINEPSKWKKIGGGDDEETTLISEAQIKKEKEDDGYESRKSSPIKKLKKSDSKMRHDSDSDLSPVQVSRHRHDSDSDISPPRKRDSVNDKKNSHSSKSFKKSSTLNSRQKDSDSDLSPVRPNRKQSPHSSRKRNDSDSDLSPERRRRRRASPFKNANRNSDSDLSPPRKSELSSGREKPPSKDENYRPTKTLSGMRAGLQNAATLRKETKEFRKRETAQIRELDDQLSGRNASTIVRDRKTGKRRNIEDETRVDEEKEKKIFKTQQKYAEWGKGLQQTENQKKKLSEDMHEMSKPLARHCDDEDLEAKLKAEIHADDPMAEYIRKRRNKDVSTVYPVYTGPPPPPNRFGIPPGYRWDGVDRSNGFESKYFAQKSNKKAVEEEAYLWSVQDM